MDRLLNKITSARWLIAIMLTITFVVLAINSRIYNYIYNGYDVVF